MAGLTAHTEKTHRHSDLGCDPRILDLTWEKKRKDKVEFDRKLINNCHKKIVRPHPLQDGVRQREARELERREKEKEDKRN